MAAIFQRQFNQLIEELIRAINERKPISGQLNQRLVGMLAQAYDSVEVSGKERFRNFNYSHNSLGLLLDCLEAGLVKKREHRAVLAKAIALLDLEVRLRKLAHLYPQVFQQFLTTIDKPMAEREKDLAAFFGIDFLKLFRLTALAKGAEHYSVTAKDPANAKKFAERQKKYVGQAREEAHRLAAIMKERLTTTRVSPETLLIAASSNGRTGEAPKRELERTMAAIEALKRPQSKTPTQRRPRIK